MACGCGVLQRAGRRILKLRASFVRRRHLRDVAGVRSVLHYWQGVPSLHIRSRSE